MTEIRRARLSDLEAVAAWLCSEADTTLWAGHRVSFPVDLATLPREIEWKQSDSWSMVDGRDVVAVVAFGQLVPKPRQRIHLARLITAPPRRGEGLGRLLAAHLLRTAHCGSFSTVSLNVARDNERAANLYRSIGFAEVVRPCDESASESLYMEHCDL